MKFTLTSLWTHNWNVSGSYSWSKTKI